MIRLILRQLWSQRKSNVWIFFELLLVGCFLWIVLNPLCVQIANKNIPNGHDTSRTYRLNLERLPQLHPTYDKDAEASDSIKRMHYMNIVREIKQLPEVKSFSLNMDFSMPNASALNISGGMVADTTKIQASKILAFDYFTVLVEGSDMFTTLGIKDVNTGEIMKVVPEGDADNYKYISENLAKLLFGSSDVAGKDYYHQGKKVKIAGVFENYKARDYRQPYPVVISMNPSMFGCDYCILFRLKNGVNTSDFEKRFEAEIQSNLKSGNFYVSGITSFDEMSVTLAEDTGEYNKMRLNISFALFGIVCAFLGIVGTFWIRVSTRRQEIGIMRSIGASKWSILRQFCAESSMLLTFALVVSLSLVALYVNKNGLWSENLGVFIFSDNDVADKSYWQNDTIKTFIVVSAVTYVIMLVTTLIGTLIPVSRAVTELPADALRDE